MVIFVDIDNTICRSNPPEYGLAKPIKEQINKINSLYNKGNTIIYWTARGCGPKDYNWFQITLEQLKSWGCKFHELRLGKPYYDILICDKTRRIDEI